MMHTMFRRQYFLSWRIAIDIYTFIDDNNTITAGLKKITYFLKNITRTILKEQENHDFVLELQNYVQFFWRSFLWTQ